MLGLHIGGVSVQRGITPGQEVGGMAALDVADIVGEDAGVAGIALSRRIPKGDVLRVERALGHHLEELEGLSSADSTFLVQFHDLPARLFWVFLQFRGKGEEFWCGKAAFRTALYAARMHGRLVQQAREKYAESINQGALKLVQSILTRKGPCKLREMLRATNNRSAAFFKPALHTLEQQGRLRVDENKRFQLVGQS